MSDDEVRQHVAGIHQFHGAQCLCGFISSRSRSRTEHIINRVFEAQKGLSDA